MIIYMYISFIIGWVSIFIKFSRNLYIHVESHYTRYYIKTLHFNLEQ